MRIGTPAATTRGFGVTECRDLTHWMCDILDDLSDTSVVARVQEQVRELCGRFPVYQT